MTDTTVQQMILEELRGLREDFNKTVRDHGERLATLERDNHLLMGNGKPGKIAEVESKVDQVIEVVGRLKGWRLYVIGTVSGVTSSFAAVVAVIKIFK